MKKMALSIVVAFAFSLILYPPFATSQEASKLGPKYGGRIFKSPSDPEYLSYEREAKAILLQEIRDRYGVELNGDILSSDQLLEIEALLRLKRTRESVEHILNRFPGALLHTTSS